MNILTQEHAERLASRDRDYVAKRMHGRWVVWSKRADHVVEFDQKTLDAHFPVRFDKDVAGGLLVGYFGHDSSAEGPRGLIIFTSIGVPVSTKWWIVPGTHPEEEPAS